MFLRKMEQIVNQYNQESITAKDAKNQLVSLASSDCLYKNYLEHDLFEQNNIEVKYMDYVINQYNQRFGDFTPYVSILDLIANEGRNGIKFLNSISINWKIFLNKGNT